MGFAVCIFGDEATAGFVAHVPILDACEKKRRRVNTPVLYRLLSSTLEPGLTRGGQFEQKKLNRLFLASLSLLSFRASQVDRSAQFRPVAYARRLQVLRMILRHARILHSAL